MKNVGSITFHEKLLQYSSMPKTDIKSSAQITGYIADYATDE